MITKDQIIISKIITYIDEIMEYISDYDIKKFIDDKKINYICAFIISQIGELAKNISEETIKEYDMIPWISIKGMRNRIVHNYEDIDQLVMWKTIKESLPELKNELEKTTDRIN